MDFKKGDEVELGGERFMVEIESGVWVYLKSPKYRQGLYTVCLHKAVADAIAKKVVQPPPVHSCIRIGAYLALVSSVDEKRGTMRIVFSDGSGGNCPFRYDEGDWELVATHEK